MNNNLPAKGEQLPTDEKDKKEEQLMVLEEARLVDNASPAFFTYSSPISPDDILEDTEVDSLVRAIATINSPLVAAHSSCSFTSNIVAANNNDTNHNGHSPAVPLPPIHIMNIQQHGIQQLVGSIFPKPLSGMTLLAG